MEMIIDSLKEGVEHLTETPCEASVERTEKIRNILKARQAYKRLPDRLKSRFYKHIDELGELRWKT